jgi:hypothetical protein
VVKVDLQALHNWTPMVTKTPDSSGSCVGEGLLCRMNPALRCRVERVWK